MKVQTVKTYKVVLTQKEHKNFAIAYDTEWKKHEQGNQDIIDLGKSYFHDYHAEFYRPLTEKEYKLLLQILKYEHTVEYLMK